MILVLGKSALSVPDTRFRRVSGSTLITCLGVCPWPLLEVTVEVWSSRNLCMEIWWMCWYASTKSLFYLQHALICVCVYVWNAEQQPSYCPGKRAVHAKSSAEMRLKWQSEFTAAFIQCHDLLCSTWMYDEWHNRISQWSYFKSPLAQGKGSAFSAVCYMSTGLHAGWAPRSSQPQFRKTRSSQPRLKLTCACITMTTVITGTTQRRRAFLLDAQNWDIMTFFVIFFFLYICFNSRCVIYSCLWRFCITIFFYLSNHCKIHRKRDMGHYSI